MKGLLAPQNTFLDTIATRFDGTRESGLGERASAPGAGGMGCSEDTVRAVEASSFIRPQGLSLVPEAGNEEGKAREIPASPSLLPGFSTALEVRRVPGSLSFLPSAWGSGGPGCFWSRDLFMKVVRWDGASTSPHAPDSREAGRQVSEPLQGSGLEIYFPLLPPAPLLNLLQSWIPASRAQ